MRYAFVSLLAASFFCSLLHAEEVLLFEQEVSLNHHHNLFKPSITNYHSPVDYQNGTAPTRYRVISMASTSAIAHQWCFFCNGLSACHTCNACTRIGEVGTLYSSEGFMSFWNSGAVPWNSLERLTVFPHCHELTTLGLVYTNYSAQGCANQGVQ